MKRRDFIRIIWRSAAVAVTGALRVGGFLGVRPAAAQRRGIFAARDHALLLALADVIVPRSGDSPGAGEIDIVPRLEEWIRGSEQRAQTYARGWPALVRAVRARVPHRDGRLEEAKLEELCADLYRGYRQERRSVEAVTFEQLRRDVLRLYYASPAGWAWVGYLGPPYLSARELAAERQ